MPKRVAQRLWEGLGAQKARRYPRLATLLGALVGLVGLVGVVVPSISSRVSVNFVGAILFGAGCLQILFAITSVQGPGNPWLRGGANAAVGILFLLFPRASLFSLSLILATVYVLGGVHLAIVSVTKREHHWTWMVALGLLATVFGSLIILRWPGSGMKTIGRFVGINLLLEAVTWFKLSREAE